jgi:hypothetical protein
VSRATADSADAEADRRSLDAARAETTVLIGGLEWVLQPWSLQVTAYDISTDAAERSRIAGKSFDAEATAAPVAGTLADVNGPVTGTLLSAPAVARRPCPVAYEVLAESPRAKSDVTRARFRTTTEVLEALLPLANEVARDAVAAELAEATAHYDNDQGRGGGFVGAPRLARVLTAGVVAPFAASEPAASPLSDCVDGPSMPRVRGIHRVGQGSYFNRREAAQRHQDATVAARAAAAATLGRLQREFRDVVAAITSTVGAADSRAHADPNERFEILPIGPVIGNGSLGAAAGVTGSPPTAASVLLTPARAMRRMRLFAARFAARSQLLIAASNRTSSAS